MGVDIEWKDFFDSISDLKQLRELNLEITRAHLNA